MTTKDKIIDLIQERIDECMKCMGQQAHFALMKANLETKEDEVIYTLTTKDRDTRELIEINNTIWMLYEVLNDIEKLEDEING